MDYQVNTSVFEYGHQRYLSKLVLADIGLK
jgi:hypothetical protein